MRIFLEILQFEVRQQLKTPFLFAVLPLFFLIHFLTITSTGVNLWGHPQANINSIYAIAVTETTLSLFGMLPVIVFVANAILRDYDNKTAAMFFVKPIGTSHYFWGRFVAGFLLAALVGLTGLLGSLTGTLMPWLDQQRIAPFSLQPFLICFATIVLPNMFFLSGLFYSVASLTRSLALTFALALGVMVADLMISNIVFSGAGLERAAKLSLADPTCGLAISVSSRLLTVVELNALQPGMLLLQNRLLWLCLTCAALLVSFSQFRFELTELAKSWSAFWPRKKFQLKEESAPGAHYILAPTTKNSASSRTLTQFISQLRMDFICVLRSPLFLIIIAFGVMSARSDYMSHVGLLQSPLYPLTSAMLGFLRYGLLQFIVVIAIYYSGVLIHRERECGVSEIMSASPVPDWLMPLSKTIALCSVIGVLLVAVMLTSISLQALDGYTNFELGLYLRSITLYNGFYFWMLCILAVLVQTLVSNKWLGMLLLFVLYIGLFTMSRIGFEHILYSFQIPFVIYSDMNGFGHLGQQVVALVIYWGFFCTLLIVTAHLLYPRGNYASFAERLHDARERINKKTGAIIVLAIAGFVGAGSWIFYNTNVLNRYQATDSLLQARADYELDYGQYENKPTPSYSDIDMTLDIFPEERRAESRGTAILTNNKNFALSEFMITTADTMQVNVLKLDKARLTSSDAEQGAYLFTLETPLAPGETLTMNWNMSLINQGFANSNHDFTVVKNGTLVNSAVALPALGFNEERKLTNNTQRKQFGLPPEPRLPALGDPDYINTLILGVDARTAFHVVMSTSADQTAVAPGALQRYWNENSRNYFEYRADRLIWPVFSFNSARYEVARDKWNNVDLEIYYDPKHSYNVAAMLNTAKLSLEYFTTAYSPYAFSSLRIVEYPRYRTSANPFPGIISYSEAVGFTLDLSLLKNIDYATIHELAHMWWGHQAYGARMQGRQMLNETLAQYSTLMMYKRLEPTLANRIIGDLQRGYLQLRNEDTIPEQPLMYTENQGHISYNKGPLAFYALQELIGEDAVNQALRNYLSRFAYKGPPFPMSRDLVDELRAVAGPDYQDLITDLFERIMLYNLELKEVVAVKRGDGYELTLTIDAHQLEADGLGAETEVPLHTWFDIALFSETENLLDQTPIYNAKHLLTSGSNTITINVPELPAYASVDPYQKMADREAGNNGRAVVLK